MFHELVVGRNGNEQKVMEQQGLGWIGWVSGSC